MERHTKKCKAQYEIGKRLNHKPGEASNQKQYLNIAQNGIAIDQLFCKSEPDLPPPLTSAPTTNSTPPTPPQRHSNQRERTPSTEYELYNTYDKFRSEAIGNSYKNSTKHLTCDNDWCTYFIPDDLHAKAKLKRHTISCNQKKIEGKRLRHEPGIL
jgi:hypothetical protein